MDARQLRYFLAVVDHEGVNRAAEALLIAQPSLSHTIATLERELGVLLFHRIGRRLTLSVAGETLIGPARTVLRNLEDAKASVAALKELRAGRIEMITMPSYGIEPLSTILTAFADKHPAVTFKVETAPNPAAVVSAVRTGVSEIGLLGASGPVREPELDVVKLRGSTPGSHLRAWHRRSRRSDHQAVRDGRYAVDRVPRWIVDAITRRRRPRKWRCSDDRRRDVQSDFDTATGAQGLRTGRPACSVGTSGPTVGCSGPANRSGEQSPCRRDLSA